MTTRKTSRGLLFSALWMSLLLVACGGESPESMLTSAKSYLAKNDSKAAVIQLKNALQNNPNLAEARFLLGKALLESGNPAAAEVELKKAGELKYTADEVVPLLAQAQLLQGQAKKIIDETAKSALTLASSKADLLASVGQANLMLGKVEAAQAAFDESLAAAPGYAPALVGQARIKAASGDLLGALTVLNSALEKSPKHYPALQLKGDILKAQGDQGAANEHYRKVLEIKPDYLAAHAALISGYMQLEKMDEAGKQLDVMQKIAPGHPGTSYLKAQYDFRLKKFKEAQESVQQHLKALPDSVAGLQLAGAIEYELKSYTAAIGYLLKALPKTTELGFARRILIASYLRNSQPDKALGVLQPVLDKIGQDSDMLALAGEVFLQNGDVDKASAYYSKASALDPASTRKRTSLALVHLLKGDTDTAYRELEEVAALDPGVSADMALIAAQLKARKFDQALKSIDALEKKQPDNPVVGNLRGSAYLGKGDIANARKNFEQSLSKNPLFLPAVSNLANLDLAQKKPEDAKKRFENVLSKDPKSVTAFLALAELHSKAGGSVDEVAALIGKAISANTLDPAPRLAIIGFYLQKNEPKKALSAAQDALGVLSDRPEILDVAGRAQLAGGDYNQALVTYGKLASLLPNSPQPYLRMAEVHMADKNKDAALQSLRKALALKDDSLDAQRGIMMLDLEAGRTDSALALARQVQKQRPKEPVGYVFEGDIHAFKKSWNEAAAAYRLGIKQSGAVELAIKLHALLGIGFSAADADKFADAWLREHGKDLIFRQYLAEAATAKKDYATAAKHYRTLLDLQPNNPLVLNNLAWMLAQQKDPRALEYAEKAFKLAPGQPAIMDTLGVLLVDKGDAVRGLDLLHQALNVVPQNASIRLNLAKALIKTGKRDEAKKELETLSKLGDKFPEQAEVSNLMKTL